MARLSSGLEALSVSTHIRQQKTPASSTLPFTVFVSERKIMFSLKGILKWIEEQQHGRLQVSEGSRD